MTRTTATPTKLRSGAWGASVPGKATPGQQITIRTRSGKTWEALVREVIWTGKSRHGDGTVSIVSTTKIDAGRDTSRPGRDPHTGECNCGACEDLLSFGYRPGARIRCPECGGWAVAC